MHPCPHVQGCVRGHWLEGGHRPQAAEAIGGRVVVKPAAAAAALPDRLQVRRSLHGRVMQEACIRSAQSACRLSQCAGSS